MINADSILSMFTDRFTLLKYLQVLDEDVQKLLEKAVTSISVDKVPDTDNEYTLTINFEDGTSETTPAFEMPAPPKRYKHKISIYSEEAGGPPEIGTSGEIINDKAVAYTVSDFLAMTTDEFVAFLNSLKSSLNDSIAPTGGFNITFNAVNDKIQGQILIGTDVTSGLFKYTTTNEIALSSSWTVIDNVEEF